MSIIGAPRISRRRHVDRYWDPRLSPDGTRLLFLARDLAYMPAGYKPPGYDLAMNQLWMLDLATGRTTQVAEAPFIQLLGCVQ